MMQTLWVATLWLLRGLKKGDWLWLLIAVAMATMTVTFVSLLSETVQQSMEDKAALSLGADGVLRSSRPIDEQWRKEAVDLGLDAAFVTSLLTMIQIGESGDFKLVKLKAASESYPLRGEKSVNGLVQFEVKLEPKLAQLMALNLGKNSTLTLGHQTFQVVGTYQPNALEGLNAFAPELMIRLQDLPATQLLGAVSRATYELSVAGKDKQVAAWLKRIRQQKNPAWQILSAQAPSADLQKSMETAALFLQLAALSAVIIAGLSILIASRFYLQSWQNSIALMRAFGASQSKIRQLFAWQLSALALIGSALGVLIGLAFFIALKPWLADYFQPLAEVALWPSILLGLLAGGLVLWSFAWQAYRKVVNVSPMQVLKSVPSSVRLRDTWLGLLFLIVLVWSLIGLENLPWVLLGLFVVGLIFYIAAYLLWRLIRWWQPHTKGWLRIILSSLQRSPDLLKIQLISFGLVLFVLMLMTFVRQDLLTEWQASLAPNTPNAFVMNVQPDQQQATESVLQQFGLQPRLVAMARGRLVAKNGEVLVADQQSSNRARRLLEREANVALLPEVPSHNEILETSEGKRIEQGISIEKGMAELFDIELGDQLTFDFVGQMVKLPVTSIREVVWQNFEMNFFFILPQSYQMQLPISYMGNFYLTEAQREQPISAALNESVPGVLLIDISVIMQQVQQIMNQASWAVTGLYGFTLVSSILVLFTATLASQKGRVQGWLLLRTIGATQSILVKMGLMEFALLGLLSGVLAATFAQIASGLLGLFLFKMPWQWHPELWLLSLCLGALSLLVLGWLTQRRFLSLNPMELQSYLNRD